MQEELHLKDYMAVLSRRRGIAILFFLAIVLVVALFSFISEPVYRATVTLLIDMENPNVLTSSGMVALETQHYYSYKEYYQSQKEIITSLNIIKMVFDEFDVAASAKYASKKEPLISFLKSIKTEAVRDTRLLKLHVENEDPVLAAKIANRIAEIYVMRNLYYISRDELMNLLKNEYLKLEAKLSEYNKTYKDKHPKMIRLKQEIKDMAGKIENVKRSQFDAGFFSEKALTSTLEYTFEGFKANNVSIQDPADIPMIPVRPRKTLNILLAIIVGFFGGIGLAFFAEYLDDTVKTSEDLNKLVGWPVLGSIPDINKVTGRMSEIDKDMLVHKRPKDPVAEAFRSIRTSVLFCFPEDASAKSIVITSPGPQEGKTTSLCNFAIALAQNEKRVLLVDADMRKPRLHQVFRKKNERGLSNYLIRQVELEHVVQETKIKNLYLVSGGPHPPNPSELLSRPRLKEFIELAKNKFDYVIFDTPPIAVVTDAAILSGMTDGTIVIVESGKSKKVVFPMISNTLKDTKANVLGAIINRVSLTSSSYYYYSRYYGR